MPILLSACGGGDEGDDNTSDTTQTDQQQVNVTGQVSDSDGLGGVVVSAAGVTTTSDANGFYHLNDVPVPADGRLEVTFEKAGYGRYQRSLEVAGGENYALAGKLMPYAYSETIDNADQAQTVVITDASGDLITLHLPDGALPAGQATVNVAVGNPATDAGLARVTGDFMAATAAGGAPDTPLESVVYTNLRITDSQGSPVNSPANPVGITLRLPDALQSAYAAGDTIPWWSYDPDNSTWLREDADPSTEAVDDAVVTADGAGVLYAEAAATHFSWWNVDKPIDELACLRVQVVDDQGNPATGAQIIAEGDTYNGRSMAERADADGFAEVTVKRSTVEGSPEQVQLYADYGNVKFIYPVSDAAEGDTAANLLNTPALEGSRIEDNSFGDCVTLQNNITVATEGTVTGLVSFEGGGVIEGQDIFTNYGAQATTGADGRYTLAAPVGQPVALFIPGRAMATATVDDAGTPVTVDFTLANEAPAIESVTRTPEGSVDNGDQVQLTAVASDLEGEAVSYTWSADQGSLSADNGDTVTWTAPADGLGTATVTVTAMDTNGGQSSADTVIVWGGGVGGTALSFRAKDTIGGNNPVQGLTVALYEEDGVTIAQSQETGPDGVVDFGDIGRERATVTLAYTEPNGDRVIETFVDVPVGALVYYPQEDDFLGRTACNETGDTANIRFQDVSPDAGTAFLQPIGNLAVGVTGGFNNVRVCQQDVQSDGRITLLAEMLNNTTLDPIEYGFLLDQEIVSGDTYLIPLDKTPAEVQWSSSAETMLRMVGRRKGVDYFLITDPAGTGGTLQVPTEFPFEYTDVVAVSTGSDTLQQQLITRYQQVPGVLDIQLPDYSVSDAAFDPATRTLGWTINGSRDKDFLALTLRQPNASPRTVWRILVPGNTTSLQLPDLPVDWVDVNNLSNYAKTLNVFDVDSHDGLDAMWTFLAEGNSLREAQAYGSVASAVYVIDPGDGSGNVSGSGGVTPQALRDDAPVDARNTLLQLFGGLHRR